MKILNFLPKRLPMLIGYGALILSMLACAVLNRTTQAQESSMFVDNGIVKVKADNGDLVPVAGNATFSLTGKLESTNPWKVAGQTLSTNETTKIEQGLQVGDLVSAQGTVLDDNTWVAYSIARTQEQTDPTVVLIGTVDSIDPWVVNGTKLNVTNETKIEDGIKPGMIVRVAIQLLDDGTWRVLHIAPLGNSAETAGCATVVATIVSVSGDNVQFLGWPEKVTFAPDEQNTDDNENDVKDTSSLSPGDTVSAVVCAKDGQIIISQITILDKNEDSDTNTGEAKVLVCHKVSKNPHTLSLPPEAVPAHLAHGDTLGACP